MRGPGGDRDPRGGRRALKIALIVVGVSSLKARAGATERVGRVHPSQQLTIGPSLSVQLGRRRESALSLLSRSRSDVHDGNISGKRVRT